MNYLTDERRHALASEYVLGTLRGRARIRFQGLLMQHPGLRKTLWQWENSLNALGGALPAQTPHPQVWERIQAQLGFVVATIPAANKVVQLPRKPATRSWQWLAGLSSAAAIILTLLLIWPQPERLQLTPTQVAVVQGEKAQALWLIEMDAENLSIQATDKLQPATDQDYQLWLVAADGRAPVSLGLLPKQGKLVLPRIALIDQVEIAALAVSLEPLGGSPSGQPTKVLYTAELVTL